MSKLISIVVPVFNEAEIINDSVNALIELRNQISYQVELIFVDDGSIDDTLILLKKFASKHSFIKIISFLKILVTKWHLLQALVILKGTQWLL